ncbi:Alpha/Beta hydrolase protein [Cercophora scortea]|uniref:Alpha/Beta hydrolase protein n=1 Tax=Cercophora scortea TaxID=314031 RepID=A0AAE0M6K2_9PEZI|nr:Alpha/Beta hydrolase protein [Cercophora scortea]
MPINAADGFPSNAKAPPQSIGGARAPSADLAGGLDSIDSSAPATDTGSAAKPFLLATSGGAGGDTSPLLPLPLPLSPPPPSSPPRHRPIPMHQQQQRRRFNTSALSSLIQKWPPAKHGLPLSKRRLLLTCAWLTATVFLILWLYVYQYGSLPPLPVIGRPSSSNSDSNSVPSSDIKAPGGSGGDDAAPPDLELGISVSSSSFISSALLALTRTTVSNAADATGTPLTDAKNNAHSTRLLIPTSTTTTSAIMKPSSQPQKPPGVATAPTVTLPQGKYVGATLTRSTRFPKPVEVFRGVPFAQSTGGENRFRLPQPLPPSDKTFDAVSWGNSCPQNGPVRKGFSEDCLNANIYRPAGPDYSQTGVERKLLPVAVYVHGGGFNGGTGAERNMASFISFAADPMIGINFNYRIGALGFLPSAVTAREGLLNLGLRDQQMALEWIRDNIEAFGGNPENITILGFSAGAHSIGHHIMYYAQTSTRAPFAKAILESGATTARAVLLPTHPRHLVQFREFLAAAGVAGVPEDEIFTALRKLPLETITQASHAIWDKYSASVTWPFQPVIDGPNDLANSSQPTNAELPSALPVIPDLPINSWRQGKYVHIPVLTGYCPNEGSMFIPSNANTNSEFRAFFKGLIPSFTDADLDDLEKLYPDPDKNRKSPYKTVPAGKGRQWARLDAAYSQYAYICPVLQTAHFLSTNGDPNPVHVYRYAATSTWGTANHGDQAQIVAHDMSFLGGKNVQGLVAVSDAMHGAWARFVASKVGDLNANNTGVEWPVFGSPFVKEEAEGKGKRWWWWWSSADDEEEEGPPGDSGRIMVFGEGNDERLGAGGSSRKGTPAQVKKLSAAELRACRFWWERIELSEGLGRRGTGVVSRAERAKL